MILPVESFEWLFGDQSQDQDCENNDWQTEKIYKCSLWILFLVKSQIIYEDKFNWNQNLVFVLEFKKRFFCDPHESCGAGEYEDGQPEEDVDWEEERPEMGSEAGPEEGDEA